MFTPSCATAGCHSGANPPESLNLEAANSYAMLVGIASSQDMNILRVDPGNPDGSYLIQKMEGTAPGSEMPPNAMLPQADIDVIRQWISDGAIDDRAQASNPVRVSSISPAPGASLSTAPTQIVAGFDRDVDASTVNTNTFLLTASGNDGTFNDGNETAIDGTGRISVPGANPASAVFDLNGVALADDTYEVRLSGSGGSLILDLDANALDGEYLGAFPSGNGTAGGDFVSTFVLSTATLGPTLDEIQAAVFTPECASCHSGPTGATLPAGMDLSDADASHAALVGVDSIMEPGIFRVVAGDPETSYLIDKLEGTHTNGSIMPPSGRLDQATIDVIRQWISDGAAR